MYFTLNCLWYCSWNFDCKVNIYSLIFDSYGVFRSMMVFKWKVYRHHTAASGARHNKYPFYPILQVTDRYPNRNTTQKALYYLFVHWIINNVMDIVFVSRKWRHKCTDFPFSHPSIIYYLHTRGSASVYGYWKHL